MAAYTNERDCQFSTLSRHLMFPDYGVGEHAQDRLPYRPAPGMYYAPTEYIEQHLKELRYKVISQTQCICSFKTDGPNFEVHSRGGRRVTFYPEIKLVVDEIQEQKEKQARKKRNLDDETEKKLQFILEKTTGKQVVAIKPAQVEKVMSVLTSTFSEYAQDLDDRQHLEAEYVPACSIDPYQSEEAWLFFNTKSHRYFLQMNSRSEIAIPAFYLSVPVWQW